MNRTLVLTILPLSAAFADNGDNGTAIATAAATAAQTALTGNYIQAGVILGLGLFGVLMHQAQTKWHNATVNSILAAFGQPPAAPTAPAPAPTKAP